MANALCVDVRVLDAKNAIHLVNNFEECDLSTVPPVDPCGGQIYVYRIHES